jgi:hypothetical protein
MTLNRFIFSDFLAENFLLFCKETSPCDASLPARLRQSGGRSAFSVEVTMVNGETGVKSAA